MIGPSTFMVTLDATSEYVFNVTDTNSFNVSLGDEFLDEYLTQDGDLITFTWNLTEFENMTLTFIATDSLGAVAFLRPQLLVCPCQNNGSCTTGGLLDTAANPLLMNCFCNLGIQLKSAKHNASKRTQYYLYNSPILLYSVDRAFL
jgi:hypothetical protein